MGSVLTIIAVALIWSTFFGELTIFNLTIGALLGLLLLSVVQRGQSSSLPRRLVAILKFVYTFFVELFKANLMIARLALSPKPKFHPHVIAVPLRIKSDPAIALLSSTITLLPGTVAMGISEDKETLYAHAIGLKDAQEARDSVSQIEDLILGFMT